MEKTSHKLSNKRVRYTRQVAVQTKTFAIEINIDFISYAAVCGIRKQFAKSLTHVLVMRYSFFLFQNRYFMFLKFFKMTSERLKKIDFVWETVTCTNKENFSSSDPKDSGRYCHDLSRDVVE